MSHTALVDIVNLKKSYNVKNVEIQVLKGISFKMRRGDFTAITGKSGCGKTTFLNIVGGIDTASDGIYKFGGCDVLNMSTKQLSVFRNEMIGYVFQQFHLIKSLSALDNVIMPLGYRGVTRKDRIIKAEEVLNTVGLYDKRNNYPTHLSGGEQQRIAIARAIVGEPQLIIADEPTGNLDSQNAIIIMGLLSLLNQAGKTILLVTHDMTIAQYASKMLTMSDGIMEDRS